MTRNQIQYNQLLEQRRANRESERQKRSELGEQRRHALAAEDVAVKQLGETTRHNVEQERVASSGLLETIRSNQENESIKRGQLSETMRANLAKEQETHRSNVEQERIKGVQTDEAIRSNKAREAIEIGKAAAEAADMVASQLSKTRELGIRENELSEKRRHNVAMEVKDVKPTITVNQGDTTVTTPKQNTSIELGVKGNEKTKIQGFEPKPGAQLFSHGALYQRTTEGWEIQDAKGKWHKIAREELPFEYTNEFARGGSFGGTRSR